MRSAVLFLVFNRPDTTRRVLESIRQARPPRLYVAADGPRMARAGEAQRCAEVRALASAVDWPCEVRTLFRDENLGCRRAVSGGISWFFEHEAEGIIVEDDCVADPSFFAYADELLARYRDDPRVMCVSGDNFISGSWRPEASYYFSQFVHIWGWATWRRAWSLYDAEMNGWKLADKAQSLQSWLPGQRQAQAFWRNCFDAVAAGKVDTWDYQWVYTCWRHGGLSAMPATNLISNIGFGPDATHTVTPESKLARLPVSPLEMPLRHPPTIHADRGADLWTTRNVFGIDERPLSMARIRRSLSAGLRRLQSAWQQ